MTDGDEHTTKTGEVASDLLKNSGRVRDEFLKNSGSLRGDFLKNSGQYYPDAAERLAAQEPEKLRALYEGARGYQLMHSELRQSLFDEMPEMKGVIEIVDHSANPEEEVKRIAASLNAPIEVVSYGLLDKDDDGNVIPKTGEARPVHLPDGKYICTANAWGFTKKEAASYSFEEIKTHARIKIHETFHCLDDMNQSADKPKTHPQFMGHGYYTFRRASEMFADVGAQALMLNNGDTSEITKELITGYDFDAPFREQEKIAYDNGPVLRSLLKQYDGEGGGLTSFYMKGWKKTLEQVASLRNDAGTMAFEPYLRDQMQGRMLRTIYEDLRERVKREGLVNDEPFWQKIGFENIDKAIETFFDDLDFVGIKEGKYQNDPPEFQRMYKAIQQIHPEFGSWIAENKDMLPAAERMLAAQKRINAGYQGPLEDVGDKNMTPSQMLGVTAQYLHLNNADPLAQKMFDGVFTLYKSGYDDQDWYERYKEHLKQDLKDNPAFAKALADGKSIQDCYSLSETGYELLYKGSVAEKQPASSSQTPTIIPQNGLTP